MTSFFGELRRRNVVKVAVAYAIVGWLLVEITSTVLPTFEAPQWVLQTITFVVILGFPLALILSWAYEITPGGIKLERDVTAEESITHVTGRKLDFAIIGALVLALGFVVYNYVLEDGEVAAGILPNSIAVLPLENISPDPSDAYFAVGIHEEILSQLAKIRDLNVIARTSVLGYPGSGKSIPQIADELNVQMIMEGSVRIAGDDLRVTAQLIDGATNIHLWTETYPGNLSDIFAIQADIATRIAMALEAELLPSERENIERVPTNSPEAYTIYLKATSTFGMSNVAAHALLDQAISLDPDFALAYASKARIYASSLISNVGSPGAAAAAHDELERNIRENAEKALSLDPDSGRAHLALGHLELYSWRWTEARRAYEQAYQAGTIFQLAWLNAFMGRRDEAVEVAQRSVELNPNGWSQYHFLGLTHGYLGEHDAAIESLRKSVDLGSVSPITYQWLAFMEIARGNPAVGLNQLQFTEQLMGENKILVTLPEIAYAYARIGRTGDAQRLFDEIREMAVDREVGAGAWALAYLAIGDQESALEWLEVAVEKIENHEADPGFYNLMLMKMNVMGDPILDQLEFVEVRSRLGFRE